MTCEENGIRHRAGRFTLFVKRDGSVALTMGGQTILFENEEIEDLKAVLFGAIVGGRPQYSKKLSGL